MLKRILSLSLILILSMNAFVFAEEILELTQEEAIGMALSDKSDLDNLDDTIEELWKNYRKAIEGKNQIQTSLDSIANYDNLYTKKHIDKVLLTPTEELELQTFKFLYGKTPPTYTGQEMLDTFIKGRDFGYYSLYSEIQKLKNTRKTIEPSLEAGVKSLYNQVVSLTNTLALQKEYLEISRSSHDSAVLKYDTGQISEHDLKISELNLLVLEKQVEQISVNVSTLKMNLNQLINTEITMEYQLEDIVASVKDIRAVTPLHDSLENYIEAGHLNRSEVKNARLSLDVKKREETIIKTYLKNDLLTDRVNAEIAVLKSTNDLELAEQSVKENISDGYIKTLTYWNDYLLSVESLTIKENSFNDMLERNKVGQITNADLNLVEYQVKMAYNTVENNLRNYLNSVDKMDKASSIGPAY